MASGDIHLTDSFRFVLDIKAKSSLTILVKPKSQIFTILSFPTNTFRAVNLYARDFVLPNIPMKIMYWVSKIFPQIFSTVILKIMSFWCQLISWISIITKVPSQEFFLVLFKITYTGGTTFYGICKGQNILKPFARFLDVTWQVSNARFQNIFTEIFKKISAHLSI